MATDPLSILKKSQVEYGISTTFLSDPDKKVSEAYGVMRWATAGGEPSHTFVLISDDGKILWVQDYGHKDNGGRMYIPIDELLTAINNNL